MAAVSNFSELIQRLADYVPRSISAIAVAHHIARGRLEGTVYTNSWPQFSAVVCSYTCPGYSMVNLLCFATTPDSVKNLLDLYQSKLRSGEWGQRQYVHGDGDLLDYLKDNLKAVEVDRKLRLFEGYQYHLLHSLVIPVTPEGFVVRKLEDHHAEFVSSYWDYFVDDKVLYFKHLIENFHSFGLFLQSNLDTPIAWCMQYPFGQPGHVFVLEKYRRRGFGSLMYAYICKSIQDEGFVPAISVDVDNSQAKDLSKRLGFVQSGRFSEIVMHCRNY